MSHPFVSPEERVEAELAWLDVLVAAEVARFRARHPEPPDQYRGLYVSERDIDRWITTALASGPAPGRAGGDGLDVALEERARALREELDARAAASPESPSDRLRSAFGLTELDAALLLLAAAPDLDARFETVFAYLQDDVTRRRPTLGLALRVLAPADPGGWRARRRLAANAPLLRHGLVTVPDDLPLLSRPLRCDDRVADALLGANDAFEARLLPFAAPITLAQPDASLPEELVPELAGWAELWRERRPPVRPIAVVECAPGAPVEAAAAWLAERLGRPAIAVQVPELLACGSCATEAGRLLAREAGIQGAVTLLAGAEVLDGDEERVRQVRAGLLDLLQAAPGPVLACCREALQLGPLLGGLEAVPLRLPRPDHRRRETLWRRGLEAHGASVPAAEIAQVAATFQLTEGQIDRAAGQAATAARLAGSPPDLRAGARSQSDHRLARLARKLDPAFGWDDIILPPATLGQLREVAAAVEHRDLVQADWGFGELLGRGRGVNALFAGSSGTGKTMAAEVIAGELGLDLYAINLANVVSKYIGETEKNLEAIFTAAEGSNSILFFDEADALFGKRSEVRDAHDRYANIEIAYLLQRIERYDGVAVLATNLSQNLDEAFARRIHHVVEFPFPDAAMRLGIWRRALPARTPLAADVDLEFLASRFELAGGAIVGAAVNAAGLAAAAGGPLGMEHLALAVAREYRKLGRLPGPSDFGPYYAGVVNPTSWAIREDGGRPSSRRIRSR